MPSDAPDVNNKIVLRCPHCGALFMAKREIVGRRSSCRKCKQPFTVTEDLILKAPETKGLHLGRGEGPRPDTSPGAASAPQVAGLEIGDLFPVRFLT